MNPFDNLDEPAEPTPPPTRPLRRAVGRINLVGTAVWVTPCILGNWKAVASVWGEPPAICHANSPREALGEALVHLGQSLLADPSAPLPEGP